jgi:hypothetical protein
MRVRTFTDYPVGDPHILCVQWLSSVQKFGFLIYDYESNRDFVHGTFRYSYKPITEKL